MRASVVIPTYNRCGCLATSLASLANQELPAVEFEILIVDNGSTDNTRSVAEAAIQDYRQHRIRYLYEPVPGLLSGRHRGALKADGEILVFVDDDIQTTPSWLRAISETFDDGQVQLVGGRNVAKYECEPPNWLASFWFTTPYGGQACGYLSLLDIGDEAREIDANYVWGLNFAIRRSTLFELGGFHPDCIPDHLQRFQGDGETGLTRKANERGYRAVYQPKALVHHRIPASRVTPEYFERRSFYQGVCDSYTEIRSHGAVVDVPVETPAPRVVESYARRLGRHARQPLHHARNFLRRSFRLGAASETVVAPQEADVKRRVKKGYRAGYEFHRNAVKQDPELLKWVLKEDYWDYRLPVDGAERQDLKAESGEPSAECEEPRTARV